MDLYLIRHEHAGSRSGSYQDKYRQLTEKGHTRAAALVDLFAEVPIERVLSSPATRCIQTVEPIAEAKGLEVVENDTLWEGSLITEVLDLLESVSDTPSVLCSHGDIIPGLINLLGNQGIPVSGRGCEKGSVWIVTFEGKRIVEARRSPKGAEALG